MIDEFLNSFHHVQTMVARNAVDKGFRKPNEYGTLHPRRNQGELIALMHSELSEGLEALRKPGNSTHIPDFSGIEEELADTIIRIMDFADEFDLRLAEAILAKHNFNTTREHKHGKQF